MDKKLDEALRDACAMESTSEIYRILRPFKDSMDETGRVYGESLWLWMRDIDSLRVMIKWLDYIKNPSSPPPKRKWKELTVSQIVGIFKELFLERHGEKFGNECEELCRSILENKDKRDSLIHGFNDEVEKMDEDCKKEFGEDSSFEQHIQNLMFVANKHKIDPSKHATLMMSFVLLVSVEHSACWKRHNPPTPTDKS